MAKVQQLNLHHCEAAMAQVGEIPDSIYLLQEPYYNKNRRPGVRSPSSFYASPEARAAIYTSSLKSFKFVPMHQFVGHDISTGVIEGGKLKHPIIISSIYLDITKPTILPLMAQLVEYCKVNKLPLICGLDANAHSPLWGSPDTNPRGEDLEFFIFENNLLVHNVGNEYTWRRRNQSSIIDITLSLNLREDVLDWHVSGKETFSDHRMIRFNIDKPETTKIWSRNYVKADWKLFEEYVTRNLEVCSEHCSEHVVETVLGSDQWSEHRAEIALDHFYDTINKALDKSCPKHKIKQKDSLIWWNQECENSKNHYISLKRKAQRKGIYTPEVVNSIKEARRFMRYTIRKSKRESFREMVRETDSVPEMSKLNKILDRKDTSKLGFVIKSDGACTTSTGETLEVMMREMFPGSDPITELDARSDMEGDPRPIDPLEWVTNSRIKEAIKLFKPHKAAGPDGLRPIVLQHLPEKAITFLRLLYTACIQMGFTPSRWCHSSVLFLPKSNKKDYKSPRSFRPICLSSFLFKLEERLVVWRTEETARPLHDRQFAFRKGRSTDHAISNSLNVIEKALYRGRMVITVDLDIRGAFDNISKDAIIRAMERKGVEHEIISWYSDYLSNRTCESTLGGSTVSVKLNQGCPQGGVASPVIAWCFPYDEFLEAFDWSAVEQFGYADDGRLIIVGIDFDSMLNVAQNALQVAEKWANKAGVRFCTEKTTVMFLNRGAFQPLVETRLKLYNRPLDWSTETKYLGVLIDHKLTFIPHIKSKIAAAKRKLMVLGKVFQNSWGPSPKATKWAYTGIVRPAFAYGAIAWSKAAQYEGIKSKLRTLQRMALLNIAPVRKGTPTAALELLYDVMPLHLFVKEMALKTSVRIGVRPNWVPINTKGHHHLLFEALPQTVRGIEIDNLRTTTVWKQNYHTIITDGKDLDRQDWKDWICYTDGSKVGDNAGSGGIILNQSGEFIHISYSVGQSSVFQAEVSAILTAVQILIQNSVKNSEIDILSDSQAGLRALSNPITISELVKKTKLALNDLGMYNTIRLRWIEGHKYKYNDVADGLANRGRSRVEHSENVPACNKRGVMAAIESLSRENWIGEWEKEPGCRQSKYFISEPSRARARLLLSHKRDIVGYLARFITGHAFLRRQNAIVNTGLNPPPGDISCRMCEDIVMSETPHHLITECDSLWQWRLDTLGSLFLDDYPQWDPHSLAKFLSHKDIILLETDE